MVEDRNYSLEAVASAGLSHDPLPSETPAFGKWKLWELDHFKKYASKNYEGLLRSQVRADTTDGGRRFFEAVKKKKWLEEVFPTKRYIDWKGYSEQDFKDHYEANYKGKSRGEVVSEIESGGNSFYQAVSRRKLLDSVFPKKTKINWNNYDDEDLIKIYDKYFSKKGDKENQNDPEGRSEIHIEDVKKISYSKIYQAIKGRGLLNRIFPKTDPFKEYSIQDFKDHYSNEFSGMLVRKIQTKSGKAGKEFYNAVFSRDLIEIVFPLSARKELREYSEQELIDHYKENFVGMSRSEVAKDKKNGGGRFYDAVRFREVDKRKRVELMNRIFPKMEKWTLDRTMEIGLQLYKEHGKIPKQVQLYEMKLASFPSAARRHFGGTRNLAAGIDDFLNNNPDGDSLEETLGNVIKTPKYINFEKHSLEDLKDFYDNNFAEMSRSQMLKDIANGGKRFYRAVEKKGFVDEIFPVAKHKPRGYWSEERTLTVARELYTKHGKIPSITELKRLSLSYFLKSVGKYFGGLCNLRVMINAEQKESFERKLLEEIVGELAK